VAVVYHFLNKIQRVIYATIFVYFVLLNA